MRRSLVFLASSALAASMLALAPVTAQATAPVSQPVGDAAALSLAAPKPVLPFVKRIQSSAKKSAEARAGTIRTRAWKGGGAIKASSAKNWWVQYSSGAPGYEMKDGQKWAKVTAYRKALISKLQRSGLKYTGSTRAAHQYIKSFANSRYACSVFFTAKGSGATPSARFVCVTKMRHNSWAQKLAPFAYAYHFGGLSTHGLAFSSPSIKRSADPAFSAYLTGVVNVGTAIPAGGFAGIFAKAPTEPWTYLFGTQEDPSPCDAYEETMEGAAAWAGTPCYRIVGGNPVDSTVRPWVA